MLISDGIQTSRDLERRRLEETIVREGLELARKQKEEARRRKIQEQQEMKEMLDRYWPWSRIDDGKPRGLRNLRLEELFPDQDYQNAKRFVGTLDLGKPGAGAPLVRDGQKLTKTKEDPLIRFQLGSKDVRKAVENGLRYKTNREEQLEYKRALDKLVEEKKQLRLREKLREAEFEQRQGWSNEETLKKLEEEARIKKLQDEKTYENFKKTKLVTPDRLIRKDSPTLISPPSSVSSKSTLMVVGKNRRLSPLSSDKENGLELVDLLAKDRRTSVSRAPLCSTDVTKEKEPSKPHSSPTLGSAYLKELSEQMVNKRRQQRELKVAEDETSRRHFSTWSSLWGKPGHGAPRSATKKGAIDRLLYPPQLFPIGVA